MFDDRLQRLHRTAGSVHAPRPQPGRQRKTCLAVEGQQRKVRALIVVAVKEREQLLAMGRVIGRVQIDDQVRRPRAPRAKNRSMKYSLHNAIRDSCERQMSSKASRSSMGT